LTHKHGRESILDESIKESPTRLGTRAARTANPEEETSGTQTHRATSFERSQGKKVSDAVQAKHHFEDFKEELTALKLAVDRAETS